MGLKGIEMKLIRIDTTGVLSASHCPGISNHKGYRTWAKPTTCLHAEDSILEFISENERENLDITEEHIAIVTAVGIVFFNPSRKTDVGFHDSMDSLEPIFVIDQLYHNVLLPDGSIHTGYSFVKVRKDKVLVCGYPRNFEDLKTLARAGVNMFEELQTQRVEKKLRGVCYNAI